MWKVVVLVLVSLATACGPSSGYDERVQSDANDRGSLDRTLTVRAVNYPLQYFAARIGGELVDAALPVIDGDPANWRPTAEDIAAFQEADVVLLNGAGYARWTATATLPTSKLVDTSAGFAERLIVIEGAVTHSHGPEGDHSHGETAFTTWLDPALAAEHARAVHAELVIRLPNDAAALDDNLASLEADLDALDATLRTIVASRPLPALVASHPVYQYLAAAYELELPSVHLEPDQALSDRDWLQLEAAIVDRGVRVMLWEQEPLPATRDRLAELGVAIAVYDPCANAPSRGDWLSVMQTNARNLVVAIGRAARAVAREIPGS